MCHPPLRRSRRRRLQGSLQRRHKVPRKRLGLLLRQRLLRPPRNRLPQRLQLQPRRQPEALLPKAPVEPPRRPVETPERVAAHGRLHLLHRRLSCRPL